MQGSRDDSCSSSVNGRMTSSSPSSPTSHTSGCFSTLTSFGSDEITEITYNPDDEALTICSDDDRITRIKDIVLTIPEDTGSPTTSTSTSTSFHSTPQRFERSTSCTIRAIKALKFITDKKLTWDKIAKNFKKLAKGGWLYRTDFPECIGMEKSREFALVLFDALSRKRRLTVDKVSKDELLDYWTQITVEDFDSRLELFVSMVDKHDHGRLTKKDVQEIIMLNASACKLSALRDKAGEYAALIMETHDKEGLGYIELEQLESIILDKSMFIEIINNVNTTGDSGSPRVKKMRTNMSYFLQDKWKRIWVLCLWVFIMACLFRWKFYQYKDHSAFKVMGYCLPTAKGAAETLKFNMALILLPVCRNTITWLRSTRLAYSVPFDDNINFHKTIAGAIVLGISVHAGLHLSCDFVRLERSSKTDYMLYLSDFNHQGQRPSYVDLVSGWEGLTGITMIGFLAIAFTLATRNFRRGLVKLPKPFNRITGFNAFWYSHHLFIIVYTCLIIHGTKLYLVHEWYQKTTWMYLAVPMLIYAGERTLRHFRSGLNSVSLRKVLIYPGDVLTLQMSKPTGFRYKSGQYIFVKCPVVSSFEWHPFSVSSSPGDDFLSVHIRKQGDWSEDILKEYQKGCEPVPGRPEILRGDETTRNCWPKLVIDGPYGAPAQDYRKYDLLLLVSSGIGATPFISILRDLINTFRRQEEEERADNHFRELEETEMGFPGQRITSDTVKAYFYWVTNELGSFDWFREVMSEVADLDKKRIIELHNHLTCVYEEGDARSTLVAMIAALEHAKKGVDLFSDTKVRTHFGRPDWKNVISNLGSTHPNAKIGVFYCGLSNLAKELKGHCNAYNQLGGTQFEFHKEQF